MDWNAVYGFAMIGMSWAFCGMLGLNLGIKLERYRIAKEEDKTYFDQDDVTDAQYWRQKYDELAEEWDYEFKVKVTEGEDARGETT